MFLSVLLVMKIKKVPVQSPFITKKQTKSANTSRKKTRETENWEMSLKSSKKLTSFNCRLFNQSHSTIDMFTIDSFKLLFRNVKKVVVVKEEERNVQGKKMLTRKIYLETILSHETENVKIMLFLNWRKWSFFVGFSENDVEWCLISLLETCANESESFARKSQSKKNIPRKKFSASTYTAVSNNSLILFFLLLSLSTEIFFFLFSLTLSGNYNPLAEFFFFFPPKFTF